MSNCVNTIWEEDPTSYGSNSLISGWSTCCTRFHNLVVSAFYAPGGFISTNKSSSTAFHSMIWTSVHIALFPCYSSRIILVNFISICIIFNLADILPKSWTLTGRRIKLLLLASSLWLQNACYNSISVLPPQTWRKTARLDAWWDVRTSAQHQFHRLLFPENIWTIDVDSQLTVLR